MGGKWRESRQLSRFAELFNEFPRGEIISAEAPDFLVVSANSVIGIELTELYWRDDSNKLPHQAMESIRQRIVEMVRAELLAKKMPNMAISLYFSHSFQFSKGSALPLATKIVELVCEFLPKSGGKAELDVNHFWERLPEGVDGISISVIPEFPEVHVRAPEAAFIPKVEADHLQAEILKKERRLTEYKKKATVVWLVIIADHGSIASWFDTRTDFLDTTYESNYDRVFLFEWAAGSIYELKVIK